MLTFRRHRNDRHAEATRDEPASAPWESGRAAPEDRALGLELELIELVHQRTIIGGDTETRQRLDAEIEAVLHEIVAVADSIRAA